MIVSAPDISNVIDPAQTVSIVPICSDFGVCTPSVVPSEPASELENGFFLCFI